MPFVTKSHLLTRHWSLFHSFVSQLVGEERRNGIHCTDVLYTSTLALSSIHHPTHKPWIAKLNKYTYQWGPLRELAQ